MTDNPGQGQLGLDKSVWTCNFDIVSPSSTTENMTYTHIYHCTLWDTHSGWTEDSSDSIFDAISIYFPQ